MSNPQGQDSNSNMLSKLFACTSGRPVDPEVDSYYYYNSNCNSSLLENDENRVNFHHRRIYSRQPHPYRHIDLQHAEYHKEFGLLEKFQAQISDGAQKPVPSPSSPSKSQNTATTKTSLSSRHDLAFNKRRVRMRHTSTATPGKGEYTIQVPLKPQLQFTPHRREPKQIHYNNSSNRTRSRPDSTVTTASTETLSICQVDTSFSSDDVSLLSFHHDDDDSKSVASSEMSKQLKYWRTEASECFNRYGINHTQTANAFFELGSAHVSSEQYSAAQDFLRTASRVYQRKFGPNDLRLARALEALGVAQSGGTSVSADKAGLLLGLQNLRRCFQIRYIELGSWHVDTVETMNKICNIYMKLHWYSRARDGFLQIMTMRAAIMGDEHPSVAVAAQSLGMVHLYMDESEQAKAYFLRALNIFALGGLGKHPFAETIRQNMQKLGFDEDRVEI